MCGLTGFVNFSGGSEYSFKNILLEMAGAIVHRGPDSDGYWVDESMGVGLAHRRLSIVDLSSAGRQPMISVSQRYVFVFNGEIYNHLRLRNEIDTSHGASFSWRGHSDTETLLAGFDCWGIEGTLRRAIGMFAFAVWDRERREIVLGRDRFGEKPLYYGFQGKGSGSVFLFGSELSSLKRHPVFNADISRDALALYLRHNCIGGGNSIYQGIYKLLPGHMLTLSVSSSEPVIKEWWSISEGVERGVSQPFRGSVTDAVDVLEKLLLDAVAQQMMADVPLGAFLSGGIDSSTVVALMQAQSSRPIKTFTIGFHDKDYNEAVHAKAVARHLGTEHTELYVTPEQVLSVIPNLPSVYSEPFSDSSQIPTFLVSQLAREHVTVSLSGDAGDELFCGYSRYSMTASYWGFLSKVPRSIRKVAANLITTVPPSGWNKIAACLPMSLVGEKLHKGASVLASRSVDELYDGLNSHWFDSSTVVLGVSGIANQAINVDRRLQGLGEVERMMAMDMQGYLPNDILTKVDRAAMSVSLETRVPFLDHRVADFAWSLPLNYKLHQGITKWPLREVLYRYVPRELVNRSKMGFGVPIDSWLRGPLRDWVESLLSESRLRAEGFFKPEPIREKWAEHLSGRRNWQYHLWDILMFQAWLDNERYH